MSEYDEWDDGKDEALATMAAQIMDLRAALAQARAERDEARREMTSAVERESGNFEEVKALRARCEALEAQKDGAYSERDQCVALIARMAHANGWRVGLARHVGDPWDDDWRNIVFIDLPVSGQVSWHFHDSERALFAGLPEYPGTWDGHDTPEKYRRVNGGRALAPPREEKGAPVPTCDDPGCFIAGCHNPEDGATPGVKPGEGEEA